MGIEKIIMSYVGHRKYPNISFLYVLKFNLRDLLNLDAFLYGNKIHPISRTCKTGLPAPPPPPPPTPMIHQNQFRKRFYGTFEDLICLRQNVNCENGFTGHLQNGQRKWNLFYYITERCVQWYYGFSIAAAPARRPWRREHSNSKNIQPISFKLYIWVDTPMKYFAIEIWYSPITRTTAFAVKRHSYPPNLQNAISP